MKKNSVVYLMLMSALFAGCATLRAQNCTENAGYEKGMNDAKMGRLMALGQFATFCSGSDVELAQKGYRAGYEAGRSGDGGSQMNLSFEGGKLGLVGAYKCQITAQNQTLSDQASTESQARNNVMSKCHEKKLPCSESAIRCSKN